GMGGALRARAGEQPPLSLPNIAQQPQTPSTILRGALGAFANPLMLAAGGFGALTKRPAIDALTAATSVLEGLNTKDAERMKLEQYKFRHSAKEVEAMQNRELADFKAIRDSGMSPADQLSHFSAAAASYQHPVMEQFAKEGNLAGI